jgi:hypothetical protein
MNTWAPLIFGSATLQGKEGLKNACPFLFFLSFFFFFFFLVFRDRVSLSSPSCPGTHFVDQAGLELRNLPTSVSPVLGLKACATMPGFLAYFMPSLG